MQKFNHGFSMKRAVVILAVFLVVVTLFPIVWGEKILKIYIYLKVRIAFLIKYIEVMNNQILLMLG